MENLIKDEGSQKGIVQDAKNVVLQTKQKGVAAEREIDKERCGEERTKRERETGKCKTKGRKTRKETEKQRYVGREKEVTRK